MTTKLLSFVFLAGLLTLSGQESQVRPGALTLEEVVRLAKSGLSEELVVAKVKQNGKPFNLNSDEILELKKSGVSETVIKFLLDPTAAYAPPAPPPVVIAPAAVKPAAVPSAPLAPPKDPLALKVPPEPGVYYLRGKDEFVKLDFRPVVPYKESGRVISKISAGMIKGHVVGSVVGPASRTRVSGRPIIFYVRLPDKTASDDLVLLDLDLSESRRNIDLGTKAGKPVFPVKTVRQFDSEDVMQGISRLTVSLDHPGEYLFFLLGSADDKRGMLGRGYDFGMDSKLN